MLPPLVSALPFLGTNFEYLMRRVLYYRLWDRYPAFLWGPAFQLCSFWSVLHRPPERLLPKVILLLGRPENKVLSSQNSCSGFMSHSCGSPA